MLIIGLTGGICSGKSTVADLFKAKGIAIIDTDQIAHEIVVPGQPALEKIAEHFGKEVLANTGELDRKKLRDIIFNDIAQKRWLEELLHPLIINEAKSKIHSIKSPYYIISIPLLIETGPYDFINRILVVDVPEEIQIRRAMVRDHSTKSQVRAIIKSQASRAQRLAQADDVILNVQELTELSKKVDALHSKYMQIL